MDSLKCIEWAKEASAGYTITSLLRIKASHPLATSNNHYLRAKILLLSPYLLFARSRTTRTLYIIIISGFGSTFSSARNNNNNSLPLAGTRVLNQKDVFFYLGHHIRLLSASRLNNSNNNNYFQLLSLSLVAHSLLQQRKQHLTGARDKYHYAQLPFSLLLLTSANLPATFSCLLFN